LAAKVVLYAYVTLLGAERGLVAPIAHVFASPLTFATDQPQGKALEPSKFWVCGNVEITGLLKTTCVAVEAEDAPPHVTMQRYQVLAVAVVVAEIVVTPLMFVQTELFGEDCHW
jgi:hypothetical protein